MTTVEILTAFDIFVRWSLTTVVWVALIVLTCLALRWMKREIQASHDRARQRASEKWAVNSGDQGGVPVELRQSRPKAPETGSGLPTESELPTFLKRTPDDQAVLRDKYKSRKVRD